MVERVRDYTTTDIYREKQAIPHFVPPWGFVMTRTPEQLTQIAVEHGGTLHHDEQGYSTFYTEDDKVFQIIWDERGRVIYDHTELTEEDGTLRPYYTIFHWYDNQDRVTEYLNLGYGRDGQGYVAHHSRVSYDGDARDRVLRVKGYNIEQEIPFGNLVFTNLGSSDNPYSK